MNYAEEGF